MSMYCVLLAHICRYGVLAHICRYEKWQIFFLSSVRTLLTCLLGGKIHG